MESLWKMDLPRFQKLTGEVSTDVLIIGGGMAGLLCAYMLHMADMYYPNAKIRCRWATQDCMTLDAVPYIGRYCPSTPDVFVATGFQKWGMTTSMAAARILCDLVQDKENPYQAVFDPARRMLRPQLFSNVLNAAVNLLTPTKPRCPHLGCALKWNRQEHSWDCPCHSSRFDRDGRLLDSPATGDTEL